jgi:VWFA-related protein
MIQQLHSITPILGFFCSITFLVFAGTSRAVPQSPDGPMAPRPGVAIQGAPPQAPIKVQVSLVNTPVVVRNNQGEMVNTLQAKDFQVSDNGVPQKITHFALGTDPISMVLLVENSSRIAPLLPQVRKTGVLFTQTVLGPTGETAIVSFNDSVDKLQDFTSNADLTETTLAQLPQGTSGAKLYDAMTTGVEMLTSRPVRNTENSANRRIMMILAESVDYGSFARLGDVLRKAQLANVTIYGVGLSTTRSELQAKEPPQGQMPITPPGISSRPPFPGSMPTPDNAAAQDGVDFTAIAKWAIQHAENVVKGQALQAAAAATGGEELSTFRDRSIEKAIDQIGGELHAQYNISYQPTDGAVSGYHDISITVANSKLQVRARPGYYLP